MSKKTVDPELLEALRRGEEEQEVVEDPIDYGVVEEPEVKGISDYLTYENNIPTFNTKLPFSVPEPEPQKEPEVPKKVRLPPKEKEPKRVPGKDLLKLRVDADKELERQSVKTQEQESEEELDRKRTELANVLNGYMRTYEGRISYTFKKGGYNSSMPLKVLQETHYLVSNIVNSSNLPQVIEETVIQAAYAAEQVVGWVNSPYVNLMHPISYHERVDKLVRGGAFKSEIEQLAIEWSFMGQDPLTRLWLKMGLLALEVVQKNAPSTVSRMETNITATTARGKYARNSNEHNKDL